MDFCERNDEQAMLRFSEGKSILESFRHIKGNVLRILAQSDLSSSVEIKSYAESKLPQGFGQILASVQSLLGTLIQSRRCQLQRKISQSLKRNLF
jgi:hypothetical protein